MRTFLTLTAARFWDTLPTGTGKREEGDRYFSSFKRGLDPFVKGIIGHMPVMGPRSLSGITVLAQDQASLASVLSSKEI